MLKKLGLLISLLALEIGCDYISDPIKHGQGGQNGNQEVKRVVLLEEFTGHQCQNCPEAHAVARVLKDQYGAQIAVIAIHAGSFANVSAEYPYDFRTQVGNELFAFFNGFAVPSGMVNRKDYSTSRTHLKTHTSWNTLVAEEAAKDPDLDIRITKTYNSSARLLTVKTDLKGLRNVHGNFKLSVFLTESGIISPQKNGSQRIENYTHNNVLRASLNGTYGTQVMTGGIAQNKEESYEFSITLPAEWVAESCEIIAFVYDADTYYVAQAAKKYVRD
ncbi:MAG: Omp28 family outer membrane lipoprotein [Thermaurantimonas sp.]|uniref:Omp28 family outer membrane lipoprotein n=1 Tax=Thermaurantimonas sp. TaxID=2681568 RepID=UPI003918BAA0